MGYFDPFVCYSQKLHSKSAQHQATFVGAAAGKYTWDDSEASGAADNLGDSISKYSWADGKKTVSVYVELDDLDAVPDDDIKIASDEQGFILSIIIGGTLRELK